jgi:hypothetical protein
LKDLPSNAAQCAVSADIARDKIAFWLYTFGSRGRVKYAMQRHRATLQIITDLIAKHNVTVLGGALTFYTDWLARRRAAKHSPRISARRSERNSAPTLSMASVPLKCSASCVSQHPDNVRYDCTGKPVGGIYVLQIEVKETLSSHADVVETAIVHRAR